MNHETQSGSATFMPGQGDLQDAPGGPDTRAGRDGQHRVLHAENEGVQVQTRPALPYRNQCPHPEYWRRDDKAVTVCLLCGEEIVAW